MLEHVVRIKESTLAETHPSRLASQHNLATAYYEDGQTQEAIALMRHVVETGKITLPEDHPFRSALESWLPIMLREAEDI